jgi:hypothetical protein
MFTMIPIVEDSLMLPSDLNSTFFTKLSYRHLSFIPKRAQDMSQVTSLNYLDITYQA